METLYIICIGLLVFFSFSVLTKRNKPLSERLFSAWILLLLVTVVSFLLHVRSVSGKFPVFMTLICDSHIAHGALLFLYVRAFTDPGFTLLRKHLLHLAPVLLLMAAKLVLNYVFGALECYTEGACFADDENGFVQAAYVYKYLVLGGYIWATWRTVQQYGSDARTIREQMRLNWVKQITMGVFFLYCGILLIQVGRIFLPSLFWERMLLGNILATLFIFIFLYLGNSYTYIFVSPSRKRFVNLSESFEPENCQQEKIRENRHSLFSRIEHQMQEEQLFARGHLTLKDLAEVLDELPANVSNAINMAGKSSFNDYINSYRVEQLKKLLDDPQNAKYKIMSLAADCGFTSKSSLLRAFKAHTGMTPSQYVSQNRNSGQA